MSFRTQVITIFWIFGQVLQASARADSVSDAQGNVNRSMNEFYQAIRKSPEKSPETAKKLSDQIVRPSEQGLAETLKAAKPQGSQGGGITTTRGASESAPAEPEVILDGSGIPAELEFPGAPKPAPKPSPSRSVFKRR